MPPFCGCCFFSHNVSQYLPQVSLKAHATILSSAARTALTQTFVNPSDHILHEVSYQFPLYDGVSVVGFQCRVGSRLLHSKVKSKEQANADYKHAVANNQTAAILDHSSTQGDVFLTRLGNVPANETITVEITFVGELKQDSQMDGIRYTLPNTIAPRYQNVMHTSPDPSLLSGFSASQQGISITVDVQMEKTSKIRQIHSPSHSVTVSLGQTSSTPETEPSFDPSRASATLHLAREVQAVLERDFVLVVKADGLDIPRALLESHPTIPGQQALMATLVPKFNLLPARPEIIFVIDRSGSMQRKISTLKTALGVFFKSLPVGICFNICSFGFSYELLWPSSRVYDASSLKDALAFVETIRANMGGTELQPAVEGAVESRLKERDLEVLILTDGQIADQQNLFAVIRSTAADNSARFFSLGIGDAASHSLIEGIARAGNGISQSVLQYEDLDRKVVRMLKGALTPHIYDCKLQVEYEPKEDDDFEVLSEAELSTQASSTETETETVKSEKPTTQLISFFEENFQESDSQLGIPLDMHEPSLPTFPAPKFLQAPYKMPPLYSFLRTTVYLLIDPSASDKTPQSLKFSASSSQGPLGLRIPITNVGTGETVHQLASRKAVVELEEEHGWLQNAFDDSGNAFWQLHPDTKEKLVARECQSLGVKYQVTGKYCSFVALEGADSLSTKPSKARVLYPQANAWETTPLGPDPYPENLVGLCIDVDASPPPYQAHKGSRAVRRVSHASAAPSRAMSTAKPGGLFGSARGNATLYIPPGARPVGWSPSSRSGAISPTPPPPMLGGSRGARAQLPSPRRWVGNADSVQPTSGGSLFGSAAPAHPGQQSLFDAVSATGNSSATPPNPAPAFTASNLFAGAATTSKRSRKAHIASALQVTPAPAKTYPSTVHALVDMQVFAGNWEWTEELFDTLGCDMLEVADKVAKLLPDVGDNGSLQLREANVVATLLVMGFLERKHAEQKGVWELVYGKADEWVRSMLAQMGSLGQSIGARKAAIMALVGLRYC
ncbi:uncharacterized protein N7459_002610 [Penicillium hispanicum]|uniref:uncharacterized protein n=1 Tax=Penicillium hispanicum TaxID=1080232 RepID=UPI002541086B|nr:uncharacterized protein N7459_002610 [Penicillium hispanicum]KAJ5586845.1 hypothetical protein N7459_002610 [Penicillium hispanicum]